MHVLRSLLKNVSREVTFTNDSQELDLVFGRQMQADLCDFKAKMVYIVSSSCHPGLYSESQALQDYIVKSCLKKKRKKEREKGRKVRKGKEKVKKKKKGRKEN